MNDTILTAGDYTTVKAINDCAAMLGVRAKLVYMAVASRFSTAGFPKHDGQDELFKIASIEDGFGVVNVSSIQSFVHPLGHRFDCVLRHLSPSKILFAGAPAWATDVRKLYNDHAWTDGISRYTYFKDHAWTDGVSCYKYFNGSAPTVYSIDLSKFKVVGSRISTVVHRPSTAVSTTNWYDYDQQCALSLPPVGQNIEGFVSMKQLWIHGTVKFHDNDLAVLKMDDGSYESFNVYGLRPLDWKKHDQRHQWKQKVIDATNWEDTGALDQLYDLLSSGAVPMPEVIN